MLLGDALNDWVAAPEDDTEDDFSAEPDAARADGTDDDKDGDKDDNERSAYSEATICP